jgi:hypothetical protein
MTHLDPEDFGDIVAIGIKAALQPFAVRIKAVEGEIADLRAELRSKAAPGEQRIRELEVQHAPTLPKSRSSKARSRDWNGRCGACTRAGSMVRRTMTTSSNALDEAIRVALAPIVARLSVVETALAELRAQAATAPAVTWAGIWRAHLPYRSGELTTHRGGLWLCTRATSATPGTDDSGWTLVCKRGSFDVGRQGAA